MEKPKMPTSQLVFGDIIYWFCIIAAIICSIGPLIALVSADGNIGNPHYLFSSIFNGDGVDVVWQKVAGGFPGGHFWTKYIAAGDGFTQFGLVVGCACALPALVATSLLFILKKKERSLTLAVFSLISAMLIIISILGVVNA